jgi:hypothetical protein
VFKLFRKERPGAGAAPEPLRDARGCFVCGKDVVAHAASARLPCAICGLAADATERCRAGHHVCGACADGTAAEVIVRVCGAAAESDPVTLAVRLLRHPAVRHDTPEHLLVPAVLVAAWSNALGEGASRAERVAEVRRRSDPAARGPAGAAAGAGTFVSVAAGPQGGDALAGRMVEAALAVVERAGAASCRRRDSLLTILAAARFAREHLRVHLPATGPSCEHRNVARDCAGAACPFNR